jgi:osmotically-inducible protein OsmY
MEPSFEKSDSQIHEEVIRQLRWDSRVDETDVGVEVDAGIVTLTGVVHSWAKKIAAQEAAHRVVGVHDVANDIEVRLPGAPGKTDTELAAAVRATLEWHTLVPSDRIESTVSHGVVSLSGTVDTWAQREEADRAVRGLDGVRTLVDAIEVRPTRVVTADEIKRAIDSALERHAARHGRTIKVVVHGGTVTLDGVVHSWAERDAAIGAARGLHGVKDVSSLLRVEPYML